MGSGSSVATPLQSVNVSLGFPKHGVRLSFLNAFYEHCGGKEKLLGLTTTDVCEKIVKPLTVKYECSFCELLKSMNHPAYADRAQVFISHAWKYNFTDVIDALQGHFAKTSAGSDVIIWFDLFTNNQHQAVNCDFQWWSTTFRTAIRDFGHTVMVLAPWTDPIPLKRAWCLFELWASMDAQCKFEVAMSSTENHHFVDRICSEVNVVSHMLSHIDLQKSEAFNPNDRLKIFDVVKTTVGFAALNGTVLMLMRSWVVDVADGIIRARSDFYHVSAVANIFLELQQNERAEQILTNAVAVLKDTNAENDNINEAAVLQIYSSLAVALKRLNKYDEAEKCYEHILNKMKMKSTEKNENMIPLMNNLALLYKSRDQKEKAEQLLLDAYARSSDAFGEDHKITLSCMHNLGDFYRDKGRIDLANEFMSKCYDKRQAVLGTNHPDTLVSMCLVGAILQEQGDFKKAEATLIESLQKMRLVLGEESHHVDFCIRQLCELYDRWKQPNKTELFLTDIWHHRQTELGADHTLTVRTLSDLIVFLLESDNLTKKVDSYLEELRKYEAVLDPAELFAVREKFLVVYARSGQFDKAQAVNETIMRDLTTSYGENDSRTLDYMQSLGTMYSMQNLTDNAIDMWKMCLEKRIQVLGREDKKTLQTTLSLATVYADNGLLDLAVPLYEQWLDATNRSSSQLDQAAKTAVTQAASDLANIYMGQQRADKAIPLFLETLEQLRAQRGASSPAALKMTKDIADLCDQFQENSAQAEALYQDALKVHTENMGGLNPATLDALFDLAKCFYQHGKVETAFPLFDEWVAKQRKVVGENLRSPSNASTLDRMDNVAGIYVLHNFDDKAEALYVEVVSSMEPVLGKERTVYSMFQLANLYNRMNRLEDAKKWVALCDERMEAAEALETPTASAETAVHETHKVKEVKGPSASKEKGHQGKHDEPPPKHANAKHKKK
jgi:tetratricopeptide (TPR) repeat protein